MKGYQRQFIQTAIDLQALKFGRFTLKSGRSSPYFFNMGQLNDGRALSALAEAYAETIFHSELPFDVLFGPAYKGIPLVTLTSLGLYQRGRINKPFCFNRKEAKDHGEGGLLVGADLQGQRVLIIDDVITRGTAIQESIALIQAAEGIPCGVVVALNREERGAGTQSSIQEIEETHKIPVIHIISLRDILEFTENNSGFNQHHAAVEAYRMEYGVA